MDHRRGRLLCLACIAALLLSGCQSQESAATVQTTLPPAIVKAKAPTADAAQAYEQTVMLYLPSLDGTRLVPVPVRAAVPAGEHIAGALCSLLLSQPAGETTTAVGGGVPLALADGSEVEVSGQVAVVNLGESALRLTPEQFFAVGQALANTLCQFGDIQFVNVLIQGVQPGLNQQGTLPAGCFQPNTREDLSTLWARASAPLSQSRRTFTAALYYPAPSGRGILCEARTLAFSSGDYATMTQTLLDALATDAAVLSKTPKCPDLRHLLLDPPVVEIVGEKRVLGLRFRDAMNAALIDAGITRSVMMASLVYTVSSFLPGIEGVKVRIGEEEITSLTPSGVYSRVGDNITFANSVMSRRDFEGFLLAECALYFVDGSGKLARVYRPIPNRDAFSPRKLYQQLLLGPQAFDSKTSLAPLLPEELTADDLLGVGYDGDVLLLNFSDKLLGIAETMEWAQVNRLVYGLVNTMCDLRDVKRVAFFIQGEQPESLGGLYLPGDFLPNLDVEE